jgi:hypothetical protein
VQDLFYITILAALMGYTKPRKTLARAKPVSRVLSLPLILSLLLQIAVVIIFQVWNTQRDLLGSGVTLSGPVVGGHEKGHVWVVVTGPLTGSLVHQATL